MNYRLLALSCLLPTAYRGLLFAAADKMHDLDLVTFPQSGRFPLRTANYTLIELDRDLFRLQT